MLYCRMSIVGVVGGCWVLSTIVSHGGINCLQGLVGRWRMMVIIGILSVSNIRNVPELIPVVGCFNEYRIANLPFLFTAMALQSFPHGIGLHETRISETRSDDKTLPPSKRAGRWELQSRPRVFEGIGFGLVRMLIRGVCV